MNSQRTPSWIQRLRAEIRSACGSVDAAKPAAQAAHPIGEWLGTVRQPTGEFASLIRPGRRAAYHDAATDHGDLMRTRVTRIKGARATLRY